MNQITQNRTEVATNHKQIENTDLDESDDRIEAQHTNDRRCHNSQLRGKSSMKPICRDLNPPIPCNPNLISYVMMIDYDYR